MRHANVAFFVPHLGCPHRCSFCDQKNISGSVRISSPDEVAKTCAVAAQRLKDRNFPAEIAFFGGSFTAIEPAQMQSLLQAAYSFVKDGSFDGIRISKTAGCDPSSRFGAFENLWGYRCRIGSAEYER